MLDSRLGMSMLWLQAAKDPYGFFISVIFVLGPPFLTSAGLSWKLAKVIEAREKEQRKKEKRQENVKIDD